MIGNRQHPTKGTKDRQDVTMVQSCYRLSCIAVQGLRIDVDEPRAHCTVHFMNMMMPVLTICTLV